MMAKAQFLFPGQLITCQDETLISTVLGSCVAVALYDVHLGVGGLNHYLLPSGEDVGNKPSPRYGNIAIEELVQKILALGASRHNLRAKIYGGAKVISFSEFGEAVGKKNIDYAENALKQLGIPIVEKQVGGVQARTITFNTRTSEVLVKTAVPNKNEIKIKTRAS